MAASEGRKTRRRKDGSGPSQRNILAAAASGVTGFILGHGGDPDAVLGRAGVDGERLADPKAALDLGGYVAMMEEAARDTRHDNFGLWFGQQFDPTRLGLIGEIALASPTLGAAVANLAELFPFHQQATGTRLVRDGELLRLEYRILDGRVLARRQDAELTMGMFANVLRHGLGADWTPEEVHFEHPRPEAWREHERAFKAPAYFGQRTNALVFRGRQLERRMPGHDLARLDRLRAELLALGRGPGSVSLLDRVKGEIRQRLPEGCPRVEEVAEEIGTARWTLQRHLAEYGLSFSDAVEEVRRDLAALYVRQHQVPIADIGFLLGYSELSAFSRAFSRWFGVSPNRLRRASTPSPMATTAAASDRGPPPAIPPRGAGSLGPSSPCPPRAGGSVTRKDAVIRTGQISTTPASGMFGRSVPVVAPLGATA